jgi:hypothetical protein
VEHLSVPTSNPSHGIAEYDQRIGVLERQVVQIEQRDRHLTRARGTLLLLTIVLLILAGLSVGPRVLLLIGSGLSFLALVAVAGFHEHLLQRLNIAKVRARLQHQQRARYARQWSHVPVVEVEVPEECRGLARDLDLFGAHSVYQFVCRSHTPRGREILAQWLLHPADPDEIVQRQQAVRWLSQNRSLRDELELHGCMLAASETGPDALIGWAESPPTYARQPIRRWLIRGLTLAMIGMPIALFAGWLAPDWVLVVYGIVAVNVIVNGLLVGGVHDHFNMITAGKNELKHYAALFEMVDALPEDVDKLRQLRQQLCQNGSDFRTALARLERIMRWGSGRRSSVLGIPYVFAQVLWYWDFHVLEWLERWQAQYGDGVRAWFASLGEFEALCSLATVAEDHPDWCFADVDVTATSFEARALGHPLLPVDACRRNDVSVGPPQTFLLVTGSNMSGKSTLLRAMGVNAALGLAGGPVCADSLRLPCVELATSMRVTDSLSNGISFFFAELRRLKEIVDRAVATSPRRMLYLLDEILQGTNSAERHIAVAKVIGHLLKTNAIGAVSTHDLELADADRLVEFCQTVHFREQFGEEDGQRKMSFDYQLRNGVCPTTNALKLLELVGLHAPDDG